MSQNMRPRIPGHEGEASQLKFMQNSRAEGKSYISVANVTITTLGQTWAKLK